ncbi:HTH domain-containing protein [Faunimonas sp. B44]|uniref:HTH domain-containing protein n=1 Tax=Faunimonas sp. B44 TaxID=3461493 RepID=UPI004043AED3
MSAESTGSDPYEVVLADLRSKKDQIEQAIRAIEALRGVAPSQRRQDEITSAPVSDLDSPGAFLGMSIADAAKKLLAARRQPLRNPDIAAAFKRGGLVLNSKDPVNTVGSVLTRRAHDIGDIVKVDRGTWGLKEWYPNRSFRTKTPGIVQSEIASSLDIDAAADALDELYESPVHSTEDHLP